MSRALTALFAGLLLAGPVGAANADFGFDPSKLPDLRKLWQLKNKVADYLNAGKWQQLNFKTGYPLAEMQDRLLAGLAAGQPISARDLQEMEANLWVDLAEELAPGNLVIRQFCLIDLARGTATREGRIWRQLNILGGLNGRREEQLWLEGYSYWLYTKAALVPYLARFPSPRITQFMQRTEEKFRLASYRRSDGRLYPVPMGDLWDGPLENHLQNPSGVPASVRFANVSKYTLNGAVYYQVWSNPVGFNLHTPDETRSLRIYQDRPYAFAGPAWVYYQGYAAKYPRPQDERNALQKRALLILSGKAYPQL
jgi:hypothetical protein